MSKFPLSTIRHSAAHVLAQAVQVFFKDVKLAIGPAIDTGFYYDFELDRPLTDTDLEKIEVEMKRIINEGQEFKQYDMAKSDAIKLFKDTNQDYKCEIMDDLNVDNVSIYENGPFLDLCRGPHVDKTSQIGAVKLLKVSGAYWRGSENNKMLQRIYGTAFSNPKELKKYLFQLEEAKKRDHRKLGKELQLFSIQEDIGGGLVLWHPNGAAIRTVIEDHWRKEHQKNGYQTVFSPHIGRDHLWHTSGHLEFYEENMFAGMDIDHSPYYLKPMNCPFHIAIYQQQQVSYRDLPIRYAELGTVYRYERSGVMHGLMRVRGFTQDDAHIFCTEDQVKDEVISALEFSLEMLKTFGFDNYKIFLSTRPKDKYVGDENEWEVAEKALDLALNEKNIEFDVDEGGGAFYGPKIDIKIKDSIGREWQCSTIQFDFNLPTKFNISYINSQGEKQRPYMIHRALLGSIERFFGILIEHYAGKFPTWLAPIQLRLLPLTSKADGFIEELKAACIDHNIRFDIDDSNEKLGYKVRKAQLEKIPLVGIIGEKELDEKKLTIRFRDSKNQPILSISELITQIKNKTI
ncbi:MAG: threonine--tRNA ligase [Candidatus Margulisiibacteriota bacterium]|nr:threonine--tRNA ligase [Candidatus Margulisiibacteriota bacterium]